MLFFEKKVFNIENVENVENSAFFTVENSDFFHTHKSYQHSFPHFQQLSCGEALKTHFCAKCTSFPFKTIKCKKLYGEKWGKWRKIFPKKEKI